MAARQEVEKAKEAVINAEGKLALEEEEARNGSAAPHVHPTSVVPAFRAGVEQAPEFRSSQRERDEIRAERAGLARESRKKQVSLNVFTRFGDVGSYPPWELHGVVLVDGDIDRSCRVCSEVRSNEFHLRRARCGLRGVRLGEACNPGLPTIANCWCCGQSG